MKHCIIISILTLISVMPLHSMSPAQLAQAELQFKKKLALYKEQTKSSAPNNNTKELEQELSALIQKLSAVTNTNKLKKDFNDAIAQSKQASFDDSAFTEFINFLDTDSARSVKKNVNNLPGTNAYYKNLTDAIIESAKDVLDFQNETNQPFIQIMHKHIDDVFALMNMFGTIDGYTPYGRDDTAKNFADAQEFFLHQLYKLLKTIYHLSDNGSVIQSSNSKLLGLPSTNNIYQLLNIKNKSTKTIFGWLNDNTKDYGSLIRDTIRVNTITDSIQMINTLLAKITIQYPELDTSGALIIENSQPKQITITFAITDETPTLESVFLKIKNILENEVKNGYQKFGQWKAIQQINANQKNDMVAAIKNFNISIQKLWQNLPTNKKPKNFTPDELKKWISASIADTDQKAFIEAIQLEVLKMMS
jgi:hypothetical protein